MRMTIPLTRISEAGHVTEDESCAYLQALLDLLHEHVTVSGEAVHSQNGTVGSAGSKVSGKPCTAEAETRTI